MSIDKYEDQSDMDELEELDMDTRPARGNVSSGKAANAGKNGRDSKERGNGKRSMKREILNTSIYLLIVLALTYLFIVFVMQKTAVSGSSMYPTLEDGDQLLVEKVSYRFSDPKRYDIVVFPYKYEDNTFYIKRVIGLPGETVSITSRQEDIGNDQVVWHMIVSIDGEELTDDTYGQYDLFRRTMAKGSENYLDEDMTVVLGENEYFVMGDNRDNSKDSRDPNVGVLKKKDFIGKAFMRIWPFSKFGFVTHQ